MKSRSFFICLSFNCFFLEGIIEISLLVFFVEIVCVYLRLDSFGIFVCYLRFLREKDKEMNIEI